ncbi:MAG: hypothetical protein MUP41_15640 [Desulfobacterales bacterium]|nr:hypothetical protein [Desulfobacterales bacterium]
MKGGYLLPRTSFAAGKCGAVQVGQVPISPAAENAVMPPATLTTFLKPCCFKTLHARLERCPELQMT